MSFDVDIDVKSHTKKDDYGIPAVIYDSEEKKIRKHNSGFYFNCNIPEDKETGWAAIDYKDAEDQGFIKIDLLTNYSYDFFHTKQDILDAMNKEPDWDLLLDEDFINKLPQISGHYDLIRKVRPKSIEELSDVLALMRPGKKHLLDKYLNNRNQVRKNLYTRPKQGYLFKKSHAIAYAVMLVCVMNKKNKLKMVEI